MKKKKKVKPYEKIHKALLNRFLQSLARNLPGCTSLRICLHRLRGVSVGNDVFIGTDVIIDTSAPYKVSIGNNVVVGMRTTLIGHFGNIGREFVENREASLVIEDDVFIGPGVIILPKVRVHKGAVIMAGSVVTKSVPSQMVIQGNPAKPIARCEVPLTRSTPMWDFYKHMKPLRKCSEDIKE